MTRFRLLIEYDGTAYFGWQIQDNQPTIQGEIERAMAVILRKTVRITGAGRTDSGVHARGQIAHFDDDSILDAGRFLKSLNGILNKDIRIKRIESVSNDFHARYSAVKREYCYFIAIRPQALHRNFVWQLAYTLNIDDMNQAAKLIEGRHNFESFCRTKSDVKHHDCHVEFSNWSQRGEYLIYTIRADRFLHGMVRTLVGMFVDIGRYRLKTSDISSILETKNRKAAGQAAPPQGLILEKVYYK